MLSIPDITPIILTYNEEANIRRALESLRWAKRVVIVDSGSVDRTRAIGAEFENVEWYEHPFTSYASQWTYATTEISISSLYILALDADMQVTADLAEELNEIVRRDAFNGGVIGFTYSMHGRALRGSILRPQPRLLRMGRFSIRDSGHNNEFIVPEPVARVKATLIHDDRKSADRWLESQFRYSREELPRLLGERPGKAFKTWIRTKMWFTPIVVGAVAYVRCGGPRAGAAAKKYALERAIYEALLQYRYVDHKLRGERREVV